jgi:hypothetical protein
MSRNTKKKTPKAIEIITIDDEEEAQEIELLYQRLETENDIEIDINMLIEEMERVEAQERVSKERIQREREELERIQRESEIEREEIVHIEEEEDEDDDWSEISSQSHGFKNADNNNSNSQEFQRVQRLEAEGKIEELERLFERSIEGWEQRLAAELSEDMKILVYEQLIMRRVAHLAAITFDEKEAAARQIIEIRKQMKKAEREGDLENYIEFRNEMLVYLAIVHNYERDIILNIESDGGMERFKFTQPQNYELEFRKSKNQNATQKSILVEEVLQAIRIVRREANSTNTIENDRRMAIELEEEERRAIGIERNRLTRIEEREGGTGEIEGVISMAERVRKEAVRNLMMNENTSSYPQKRTSTTARKSVGTTEMNKRRKQVEEQEASQAEQLIESQSDSPQEAQAFHLSPEIIEAFLRESAILSQEEREKRVAVPVSVVSEAMEIQQMNEIADVALFENDSNPVNVNILQNIEENQQVREGLTRVTNAIGISYWIGEGSIQASELYEQDPSQYRQEFGRTRVKRAVKMLTEDRETLGNETTKVQWTRMLWDSTRRLLYPEEIKPGIPEGFVIDEIQKMSEFTYVVQSQMDAEKIPMYIVNIFSASDASCTCEDFAERALLKGGEITTCKHIFAVRLGTIDSLERAEWYANSNLYQNNIISNSIRVSVTEEVEYRVGHGSGADHRTQRTINLERIQRPEYFKEIQGTMNNPLKLERYSGKFFMQKRKNLRGIKRLVETNVNEWNIPNIIASIEYYKATGTTELEDAWIRSMGQITAEEKTLITISRMLLSETKRINKFQIPSPVLMMCENIIVYSAIYLMEADSLELQRVLAEFQYFQRIRVARYHETVVKSLYQVTYDEDKNEFLFGDSALRGQQFNYNIESTIAMIIREVITEEHPNKLDEVVRREYRHQRRTMQRLNEEVAEEIMEEINRNTQVEMRVSERAQDTVPEAEGFGFISRAQARALTNAIQTTARSQKAKEIQQEAFRAIQASEKAKNRTENTSILENVIEERERIREEQQKDSLVNNNNSEGTGVSQEEAVVNNHAASEEIRKASKRKRSTLIAEMRRDPLSRESEHSNNGESESNKRMKLAYSQDLEELESGEASEEAFLDILAMAEEDEKRITQQRKMEQRRRAKASNFEKAITVSEEIRIHGNITSTEKILSKGGRTEEGGAAAEETIENGGIKVRILVNKEKEAEASENTQVMFVNAAIESIVMSIQAILAKQRMTQLAMNREKGANANESEVVSLRTKNAIHQLTMIVKELKSNRNNFQKIDQILEKLEKLINISIIERWKPQEMIMLGEAVQKSREAIKKRG